MTNEMIKLLIITMIGFCSTGITFFLFFTIRVLLKDIDNIRKAKKSK